MSLILIIASIFSSMVISDISQVNRCEREKSETQYCKEKIGQKMPIKNNTFGSEN